MKIPKKIRAFGYDWKVIVKQIHGKEKTGGRFLWDKKIIYVDNSFGEEESIFIHEIMEAIMVHLGYRFYGQEGSMEYQFHFDHSGFVRICTMLFQTLKDNKLI